MEDIGRYRIRGELGSGGMGVVYRAYDPVLGREVAIKTLKLSNFSEPSERDALRDRLAREARAAAALSHSGIVAIHDVVQQRDPQQGDLLCLVMERIEGQTLAHVLSTSFLDMPSALRIIRETAAALDYAHRKGIVHRDIKPANLMLDETGTVKVADFGIAKITSSQTRTESASGMIVGTAGYMAPEQLRGAPVDGHTDQFSLAVVAFEILARRRPFMADSIVALTHQVVFESPPTLSTLRPGFGPAVDAVFDKALSKSPAARYPTCSDFAADLEAKINSAVSQPTLAYPAIPPPPPKKSSPQLWWWAAAIFAILSIGGAAATYALRRKAEEPPPVAVKQVPTPQPVTVAKTPPVDPVPSPTPAPPTPTPAPTTAITIARQGEIRANPKDGQKYIFIMPGTFTMGCIPNDPICGGFAKPAHRVAIGKPFWMAQTPVTVAAYRAFAQATHREMPKTPKFNPNWSLTDHPIVNVNWDDAVAYAKWAGGRLPTEAEWEYAARGGAVDTLFPWGNDASHDLANFGQGTAGSDEQGAVEGKDVWLYTSPVASFPPNRLNLYDMAGNVSQWCADWFGPSYYGAAHEKDPRGPETGTLRVNRGGSWKSPARFLHTSFRGTRPPDERGLTTGIRCVLESIYVPQH